MPLSQIEPRAGSPFDNPPAARFGLKPHPTPSRARHSPSICTGRRQPKRWRRSTAFSVIRRRSPVPSKRGFVHGRSGGTVKGAVHVRLLDTGPSPIFAASRCTWEPRNHPRPVLTCTRSGAHGAAERRRTIHRVSRIEEQGCRDPGGHRAGCRAERQRGCGYCRGPDRNRENCAAQFGHRRGPERRPAARGRRMPPAWRPCRRR